MITTFTGELVPKPQARSCFASSAIKVHADMEAVSGNRWDTSVSTDCGSKALAGVIDRGAFSRIRVGGVACMG